MSNKIVQSIFTSGKGKRTKVIVSGFLWVTNVGKLQDHKNLYAIPC